MRENTVTILFVAKDALVARTQQQALESCGYSVEHAPNGTDAINTILDTEKSVDLILLDVDPGEEVDIIESGKRILEHKEIPIVFLSSQPNADIVSSAGIPQHAGRALGEHREGSSVC